MAVVKKKVGTLSPKKKERAVEDKPELSLPTDVSVPADALGDYSWLLFGRKKIGKTNLSAQFPKTFHLMTEPGGKALRIYQRPVTSWTEFKGYVRLLERDRTFRTQVIDTADLLMTFCTNYVCKKLGIEHPSDEDWGKGWKAVRDEFTAEITRLMNNGKGTIFISHSAEREIKKRSGGSYHSIQPTLSGQARDILEGLVDIFAYFDYEGDRRVLTIRGDETVAAGNRLREHFLWQGREVPVIDMGTTPEEGYRNLVACFNNEYRYVPPADEADADAPKMAKVKKLKKAGA